MINKRKIAILLIAKKGKNKAPIKNPNFKNFPVFLFVNLLISKKNISNNQRKRRLKIKFSFFFNFCEKVKRKITP